MPYGHYYVTISPDGEHVYLSAGESDGYYLQNGWLAVMDRDGNSGTLTILEVKSLNSYLPEEIVFSPDSRFLYFSLHQYYTENLQVYARDELTGSVSYVQTIWPGVYPEYFGVTAISISHDGQFLYLSGIEQNAVAGYERDLETGKLTFLIMYHDNQQGIDGLNGAADIVISSDEGDVYVAGFLDNKIAIFDRLPGTVGLRFQGIMDDTAEIDAIGDIAAIAVSADGRHIYAAGQGDDAISVFGQDFNTGQLTLTQVVRNGVGGIQFMNEPRWIGISPDDRFVYVSGGFGPSKAAGHVFARDVDTGELTLVFDYSSLIAIAMDGEFSPDGRFLYLARQDDFDCQCIQVWERDHLTGALSWRQDYGLNVYPKAIEISPDGTRLFLAEDEYLRVFEIDQTTGVITEIFSTKYLPFDTLDANEALAISNNGQFLFLGSRLISAGQAMVVFRIETNGSLEWVQTLTNNETGLECIYDISFIVPNPAGNEVIATDSGNSSLCVFRMDRLSGSLFFAERISEGVNGVNGISAVNTAAVNPAGTYIYTGSWVSDAITVSRFHPQPYYEIFFPLIQR